MVYCVGILICSQTLGVGWHENIRIIFDIKPNLENRQVFDRREIPFLNDSINKSIAVEIPAFDVGIFRWE